MAYGISAGNSIGSLLRFIQEQKAAAPPNPPATEVGSPVRAMVQEPLKSPEAVDTAHVVSVRPEGVPTALGQTQSAMGPSGEPALPIGPAEATPLPGGIAPTPTPSPMRSSSPSQPSSNQSRPSQPSSGAQPSVQKGTVLGTTIKASTPTYKIGPAVGPDKGTFQNYGGSTAAPSRVGPIIAPQGTPTPAPPKNGTPSQNNMWNTLQKMWNGIFTIGSRIA